uniref:Uncharacterized protein n=1 Tax=Moniliophthora roreri TaxID=221103 RepID=A0A0W0GCM0_MONRR
MSNEEWVAVIAIIVVETLEEKKNKGAKVAVSEFFKGDHKDTQGFMLDVELYMQMNPKDYNMNEKKKLFLLSYMRGKSRAWKEGELADILLAKKEDEEESWEGF